MAVRFGMTIAEIIAQLTRGFRSVAGRAPDGLEKIKIQQEAVQKFKDMNKVVDMQGRTLDPNKTIMGGTQEGAALKSGIMKATGAKPVEARVDISKYIKDGKPDDDKLNALVDRDMILKEEADSLATTGKNYERFQKISAERKNIREIIEDVRKMFSEDMAQGGRIGFKEGNGDGDGITGIALSIEERMERIRKLLKQMQDIQKGKGIDPDPEEKAEGGRIGLKAGMSKRAFLKLMGGAGAGLAALKTGALKLLGKEATPVATEVVKSAGSTASAPPPYFFKLIEKIKFMGEKRKTPSYKERVNEYTYTGKDGSDYELIEDLDTGNIKITKDKLGGANYGDDISYETIEDRTEMVFIKGQADETTKGKKLPDEYEEYKVEFDQDGTAADATDIDKISKMEIVEEAGDPDSLTLKKAGGGIARMLGE